MKGFTQWILNGRKHWWQPGVTSIYFGGFMRYCEMGFNLKFAAQLDSPEKAYEWMQEFRKRHRLDQYLVYRKCPECGWELPAMDFDVDGNCAFCGDRKDEEKRRATKEAKA